MPDQLEDIGRAFPEFATMLGDVGAPWRNQHGEGLCYRRDRFDETDRGRFWISPTPAVAGSVLHPNHWGPRITAWVKLRYRTGGRELLFASTHLDTHPGCLEPSARIIAAELARLGAGLPMVLGGDFNSLAGGPAWREFMANGWADAWRDSGLTDEGVVTFNGFKPAARMPFKPAARLEAYLAAKYHAGWEHGGLRAARYWRNERMDWVLFRGPFRATAAAVDTRLRGGRPASDHYAVSATLAWS